MYLFGFVSLSIILLAALITFYAPKVEINTKPVQSEDNIGVRVTINEENANVLSIDRNKLKDVRIIHDKVWNELTHLAIRGAESFSVNPENGDIYTGSIDGLVWRISKDLSEAQPIVRIGDVEIMDKKKCSSEIENNSICGRVLGVKYVGQNQLLVADSHFGLLAVDVTNGEKILLVKPSVQVPSLMIINSVDVSSDGVVYFSVMSTKWNLHQLMYAMLEGDQSGQVMAFDLRTKVLTQLLNGLELPNGLVLTHNESALLICEMNRQRILRLELNGDRRLSVFLQTPNGLADNIKRTDSGYYVAFVSTNFPPFLKFLRSYPKLTNWLFYLLPLKVTSCGTINSEVIHFDRFGKPLVIFNGTLSAISEAYETDTHILLGSFLPKPIAAIEKKKIKF